MVDVMDGNEDGARSLFSDEMKALKPLDFLPVLDSFSTTVAINVPV